MLFRCPKVFLIIADMAICSKPACCYPLDDLRSSWHREMREATLPLPPSDPSIEVSSLLPNMSHHHVPL